MPPPPHPGAVAVECYGRQAERGGGWISFQADAAGKKAPEVVELKPNTTGIWCTELAVAAGGKKGAKGDTGAAGAASLTLVQHQQFNLYKDIGGETAKLTRYVKGLKAGTVVVVSIADTACAKSRPLGPAVYEALGQLGAWPLLAQTTKKPTKAQALASMAPIEYRQAWALIGYKGAPPGTAVCAMGTRSTLLRLEATFGVDGGEGAAARTCIRAKNEDLCSIIDVVTGGGQDSAV
jgi:hypothetical protein